MSNLFKIGFSVFLLVVLIGCGTISSSSKYVPPPAPVVVKPAEPVGPPPPPPPPPIPKPVDIPAFQGSFNNNLGDDLNQPVVIPPQGLIDCRFSNLSERVKVIFGQGFVYTPFIGPNRNDLKFKVFEPYFVFETNNNESDQLFHLVGPTPVRKDILFWVRASDTCYWDNRLGARCLRSSLPIYAVREDAVRATSGYSLKPVAEIVNPQAVYPVTERWTGMINGYACDFAQIVFLSESGSLSRGWIAIKVGNDSLAETMTFIALAELRVLLANLYLLDEVLQNPEQIRSIPPASSGSFYRLVPFGMLFLADEGILRMDTWLVSRGVPVKIGSALQLTKSQIETMPSAERIQLSRYLQSAIAQLERELKNTRWCFGTDEFKFGWLRSSALP